MHHQNSSVGIRQQRRSLCVFTAGELFDLLQDAMSVVCGLKCVCSRKVYIVYLSVCASVCSSQSHALAALFVCLTGSFVFVLLCTHTSCVSLYVCNVSLQGWRQD